MQPMEEQVICTLKGGASGKRRRQAVKWIYDNQKLKEKAGIHLRRIGIVEMELEDVLQEGRIALVQMLENDRFRRKSSLTTYFQKICQNIYAKKYRKPADRRRGKHPSETIISISQHPDLPAPDPRKNAEQRILEAEHQQTYQEILHFLLKFLKPEERRVMLFCYRNLPMDRIASEMGYEHPNSAKKKVSKCRKRLQELMTNNANIRKYIEKKLGPDNGLLRKRTTTD